ncbi:hypothetical protein [Luteibacter yeojuensis]|uniref:hypothetical protein n=1 Tax=Luteibacter yeojuensis TaxID=345309 RepID=UPI00069758F9|nr:hypothetical protein [Luteibacter yeojuensis]
MPNRTATVFQRLRSLKGAWILVMFAVLIKVASTTACTLDGPSTVAIASVAVAASHADAGPDEGCLLGEPGGCHCACAHAVALPSAAPVVALVTLLPFIQAHPPAAPSVRAPASPLRPPIA